MQGHKISGILSLTTHGKHPNYVRINFLTQGLKLELSWAYQADDGASPSSS